MLMTSKLATGMFCNHRGGGGGGILIKRKKNTLCLSLVSLEECEQSVLSHSMRVFVEIQ